MSVCLQREYQSALGQLDLHDAPAGHLRVEQDRLLRKYKPAVRWYDQTKKSMEPRRQPSTAPLDSDGPGGERPSCPLSSIDLPPPDLATQDPADEPAPREDEQPRHPSLPPTPTSATRPSLHPSPPRELRAKPCAQCTRGSVPCFGQDPATGACDPCTVRGQECSRTPPVPEAAAPVLGAQVARRKRGRPKRRATIESESDGDDEDYVPQPKLRRKVEEARPAKRVLRTRPAAARVRGDSPISEEDGELLYPAEEDAPAAEREAVAEVAPHVVGEEPRAMDEEEPPSTLRLDVGPRGVVLSTEQVAAVRERVCDLEGAARSALEDVIARASAMNSFLDAVHEM
ncbi:hypothetical protein BV25DRAFT_1830850 [Artomyces pyxidatus]|uniref:Uncharacterized protein n=1 Tax=Artomyces pyxidatus TaxID=48021 RepID=A0ACB8SNH8_9AGAM|nr:hypothetical protein BV25DRAFT_1830850 [Artomyces pyxidatus]